MVRQSAAHRLIVEGRDDKWSIISLMAKHGWDWDSGASHLPYIYNAEGVEQALEGIAVSVRTYLRVGIVLDADLVPMDRWSAVRNRLSSSGLQLPGSPDPDGTIIVQQQKHVGIWLMPDNRNPGKLEDFLTVLIPNGNRSWPWAEQATSKAKSEYDAEFSDLNIIKAKIHTWLAWQGEPGQPFGTAITAATFAHDAVLATKFVNWMKRLFSDP